MNIHKVNSLPQPRIHGPRNSLTSPPEYPLRPFLVTTKYHPPKLTMILTSKSDLFALKIHRSGVTQYIFFCVLLLLLSIMFVRLTLVAVWSCRFSLLSSMPLNMTQCTHSFYCQWHTDILSSLVHLACCCICSCAFFFG